MISTIRLLVSAWRLHIAGGGDTAAQLRRVTAAGVHARATCSRKDRRSRVAAKRAEQGSAMRILIVGASGAIGRPLVRRLRAKQHEVFALTRSSDSVPPLKQIGAEAVARTRHRKVTDEGDC